MSDALTARFPEVVYLLGCYVIGQGSLRDEMYDYDAGENTERVLAVLEDIETLLSDGTVPDDQLDAFVSTHASRWLGSGRATLARVSDVLIDVLEARARLQSQEPPSSPPRHVHDRLAAWLREQDMFPPDDYIGWSVSDAGEDRWVLTPPGFAGVIFVVTPSTIRAISPAFESVPEAFGELGIA